jgi:hypothetical protein
MALCLQFSIKGSLAGREPDSMDVCNEEEEDDNDHHDSEDELESEDDETDIRPSGPGKDQARVDGLAALDRPALAGSGHVEGSDDNVEGAAGEIMSEGRAENDHEHVHEHPQNPKTIVNGQVN